VSTDHVDRHIGAGFHKPHEISNPMQYIDTDDPMQVARFQAVNAQAYLMYQQILQSCPQSAERTLAIRKLQEARMWANAAIVFDGKTYPL
jgi:hypothetical protein